MCIKPASYRTHSDFRRLVLGKMEHAGGNTSEGNRFQLMTRGYMESRPIAGSQLFPILPCESPGHNRSHRMDHTACRKIISRRDFCRTDWFLMALCFHDPTPGAEIRRILFVIYYITSISSSIFQGLSTSTPLSPDPEEVSCHWSPKNKMQVFLKGRCPRKNLHLLHKLFFSFQSHCRRDCCLSPSLGSFTCLPVWP